MRRGGGLCIERNVKILMRAPRRRDPHNLFTRKTRKKRRRRTHARRANAYRIVVGAERDERREKKKKKQEEKRISPRSDKRPTGSELRDCNALTLLSSRTCRSLVGGARDRRRRPSIIFAKRNALMSYRYIEPRPARADPPSPLPAASAPGRVLVTRRGIRT